MADPGRWFLQFDAAGGDGRPWGDGTAMAARAGQSDPWDEDCEVTPLIGGDAAMSAIRDALEQTISEAAASTLPVGERGHVYIAGWRFNPQRDLSDPPSEWSIFDPQLSATTALSLVIRLMRAGVRVRIMVWLPTKLQAFAADSKAHVEDHYLLARAVAAEATALGHADPLGIVALDIRTAEGSIAAAHHQKTIVIRGLGENQVAFCGGVDLAFTRRDTWHASQHGGAAAPTGPAFLDGDTQSGSLIPTWPGGTLSVPAGGIYTSLNGLELPGHAQGSDLPGGDPSDSSIASETVYGTIHQVWHDQHLMLRGPIVQTLEQQFAERWVDDSRFFDLSDDANWFSGQVIFSSPAAIGLDGRVEPLPDTEAAASPAGAASPVQIWRTIPWRNARRHPPFQRAEFTVMAGVSHAVAEARHLVWIFDQYFWSVPLARQLNNALTRTTDPRPDLHVIVILPPFADTQFAQIHEARRRSLDVLVKDVAPNRVGVFNLWDPRDAGRGIYCHAKAQTYDGGLLVCGSANMNRRSFLCDSELACAVADEGVVSAHQQALWQLLFRDVQGAAGQWPSTVDLATTSTTATPGATFFSAFSAAAASQGSYLIPDPWQAQSPAEPTLPTGVVLPRGHLLEDFYIEHLLDPTSVDPALLELQVDERDGGTLTSRPPRLDEVVRRLEATSGTGPDASMPNRRQSSDLSLPLLEMDPNFSDVPI